MANHKNRHLKGVNELATYLVRAATEGHNTGTVTSLPSKEQISSLMAALGRKGGKVGGKRRLKTMTAEERSAVARKAAKVRWQREKRS